MPAMRDSGRGNVVRVAALVAGLAAWPAVSACEKHAGQDRAGDTARDVERADPGRPGAARPRPKDASASARTTRGEREVTVTITEGVAEILEVRGASLRIPADALTPGMEVTLKAEPVDGTDYPADRHADKPATDVFTMNFSSLWATRQNMLLVIDVPARPGKYYYGRKKVEGGASAGSHPEPDWVMCSIGYRPGTRTYRTGLSATAARISYVVLETDA